MVQFKPGMGVVQPPADQSATLTYSDGSTETTTIKQALKDDYLFFALAAKRGEEPDPIRTMNMFRFYIAAGMHIPPLLSHWFTSRVDKFMKNQGDLTLGSVFGFTGREREKGAFTEAENRLSGHMIFVMHALIQITGIGPTSAARLVMAREGLSEQAILVSSLTTKYSKEKKEGKHAEPEPIDRDQWKFDRSIVETFLKLDVPGSVATAKDTEKIVSFLSKMDVVTPDEYFEEICLSIKPR